MKSESVSSFSALSVDAPNTTEIRVEIEDLEQTIRLNKLILEELLSSLSSSKPSKELSYDTEIPQLVSAKIHQAVKTENEILLKASQRIESEIKQGEIAILQAEDQANKCRIRKKESVSRLNDEKAKLRKDIELKEQAVQKLEKYIRQLEVDIEDAHKIMHDDPNQMIKQAKMLITAVEESLKEAKAERDEEIDRCKELEEELYRLQSTIKASPPKATKTVDNIIREDNWLKLNYENYWFENREEVYNKEANSSNESENQITDKISVENLDGEDSDEAELIQLEIAYRMKCEEMLSLDRILAHLREQEHTLKNYIDMRHST
ncbi:unnamed protein product [Blepharisma stoltei]|uniref:Uncharacterized protein n=1 Tax=Blepharisma stoltei TaxID=1481888 RepID=A0AAU9J0P6_9CILI|nr:unnamed protein product [Blepharisma stoltei]